jgi:hypothetical protein
MLALMSQSIFMDAASETKIFHIITAFETYALGDIKSIQKHKMPIAGFILCVCLIDQVSGFVYDNNVKGQRTNTERSKKFVADYLNKVSIKKYDKDELIELLRNKLVHNYSLSDRKVPKYQRYVLDYENPKLHLHTQDDIVVINIEGFINDLEKSFQLYKGQLLADTTIQRIAIEHYDMYGILVHKEIPLNT